MPGCGKHPRELGPGGKLQRCGGCKFVQYCSKECQKRHWKFSTYPHKAVCAQLKNLLAVAPFEIQGLEGYAPFILACEEALTPVEADRLASELGPYVPT
ncbi:hypothetical protein EXIGLDRAFT_728992 [Exidia glandulosa HHB12029]|uniref:MYND-type domain-containing protein n=1 Tax=Exidia glandulosa HHB12029 TaxID=1314781 RepID=A0A165CT06_EXIGL|nr:hypothetical protein EXIGLDRAFT_728992 [Exidia glandulosa HHB12029]